MFRSPRPAARFSAVVALTLVMALGAASPAFAAMSRSLVMARAQRWVDLAIPYSQTTYRDLDGKVVSYGSGYRTDCSGFVSMAWNTFKPGYSTRTLNQTATRITKEALQPGDALVAYNYHAVIFGGWANPERTKFYEYQMGSVVDTATGDGTGMRIETYPGPSPKDSPYIPYRLNGITENIDYSGSIEPIEGADRYKTAVAASRSAFTTGSAGTVVIASGENWPDALGASALAGAVGGPVLLTKPDALPAAVAAEIARLGAREAIVVGGEPAVSASVFRQLDALASVSATRVAGTDRYATSARIAEETVRRAGLRSRGYTGTVFVTTGANFPDALAASPLAAKSVWPIVLTRPGDGLSQDASASIAKIRANRALVLGSASAVSTSTKADLVGMLGEDRVVRLAGYSRYDTGFEIAKYGLANCGLTINGTAIATGANFPDALAGGVMAARHNTVLMLTPPGWLSANVADLLVQNAASAGKPRVLGGPTVLKPIVREAIALALGTPAE
ncbi:MAG: cell wall-binding repeat-containing protein [Actinobacteria bacterium]|nr:MAG: cell wall-binding repeat-containing protein [Actinomycetota bacterium]